MKKYLIFGMMGALALTFTACSSEDAVAPNPTYDGNSVQAEFSLNLPGKYTRQTTAITQDGAAFRALDKMFIAPYATPQAADNDPVKATTPKAGTITLDPITAFDHANAQDKWYNKVELNVGVNAFLVYAKPASGDKAVNGVLALNATDPFTSLEADTFKLEQIKADAEPAAAIATALTTLAGTKGLPFVGGTEAAWSAIAEGDNQLYAELYKNFSALKAGSKTDVLAYLKDQLKPALISNTGAGEDGIDAKLQAAVDVAIAAVEAAADFTTEAGLPDGAAVLNCANGVFSYKADQFINGFGWGYNKYTYPAELWYRANTGIRASNKIESTNVGDKTWAAFIETLASADKMVKPSTQSVALVNPLQYAVGNFETWIKFNKESYQVEKVETTNEATGEVTVTEKATVLPSELTLNGILVGDQKNVNWEFKPVGDDDFVIYDKTLIATKFGADYARAAQTLVCETEKDQVNVALEFINGSTVPIKGIDGIVPVGAKFYLIAPLKNAQLNDTYTVETTGNKANIFQQDYKTIARFAIESLENTAYNTIPDLTSPELEFGLSVDLEWQKGYEFDITLGGE